MRKHTIGGALLLALALFGSNVARAQDLGDPPADVTKSMIGVTPAQGERLYQALAKESATNHDEDGVKVKFGWKLTGQQKTKTGWRVRGNMMGAYEVTDKASHGPLVGWLVTVLSAKNQRVSFSYEKGVLFEYYAPKDRLTVTIEEGAEETGTYNVRVTSIQSSSASAHADLPTIKASSKSGNFSFGASADRKQLKVDVVGLPYIMAPRISLKNVGEGHLRFDVGMVWESQATITATPIQGQTSDVKFDLSYDGKSVVTGDVGTSNGTFKSTLSAQSSGKGIVASIVYDETENKDMAYEIRVAADQSWSLSVADYPLNHLGSAHWEKLVPTKATGLPEAPAHGLEGLSEDKVQEILKAEAAAKAAAAAARTERLRSKYVIPAPEAPDPSKTKGVAPSLDAASKP